MSNILQSTSHITFQDNFIGITVITSMHLAEHRLSRRSVVHLFNDTSRQSPSNLFQHYPYQQSNFQIIIIIQRRNSTSASMPAYFSIRIISSSPPSTFSQAIKNLMDDRKIRVRFEQRVGPCIQIIDNSNVLYYFWENRRILGAKTVQICVQYTLCI